jgi:hypothetical protein
MECRVSGITDYQWCTEHMLMMRSEDEEIDDRETKPDTVIAMYNAGAVGGDINYVSHTDFFDFR